MANGAIRLTWRDRNWAEQGHYIYRSQTPMNVNNLPNPLTTVDGNVTEYIDYDVIADQTYYYRIGAYRNNDVMVSDEIEVVAKANDTGPGPQTLLAGDMTDGFFGEVTAAELFTGDELASAIGLTSGVSQYSTEPWLKFAIDEKIVFIAKKPYRHSVSWDNINAVGAVYNDTNAPIVSAGGFDMKVTLMTGAEADPTAWTTSSTADDNFGAGSEWNRLIYRIHQDVPTGGTNTYHGGPQVGDNWASYTDADIILGSGNGRITWTQETSSSNVSSRVYRGDSSLSPFAAYFSDSSHSGYGWRPALRLIV